MPHTIKHTDIVLIGGGIMSATLGILLHEKFPEKRIVMLERLPKVAEESSEAWNNAGTGHSGNCELNYTPEINGKIDITKAVKVAKQFHESLDFWRACGDKGYLQDINKCLNEVPHLSFVEGAENVDFLRKRAETMKQNEPFTEMKFTTDPAELKEWIPLMMEGRENTKDIAATKINKGYDVNYGEITDQLVHYLSTQPQFTLMLNEEVEDIQKEDEHWLLSIENKQTDKKWKLLCSYVFIGAGGGALPLLEKADIEEGEGYGGFPVSGMWLRCNNREVIEQHHAKVYGKAEEGSPPMSVPHLDSRIIEGKRELLFGPYAGFSTKFLKNGSIFDLAKSIELDNIRSMFGAGIHNIPLTEYLIKQVTLNKEERLAMLTKFYPLAKLEDWDLVEAGQRVQIIKPDEEDMGKLQFGTEVIVSSDKSISALLGASPGASTSYAIMNEVMTRSFG